MKTIVKTLILLIALALSVTAIMMYARSKVAPPISIKQVNQYQVELENSYDRLKKATIVASAEKEISDALSLAKIMGDEHKISTTTQDAYSRKFMMSYAQLLLHECFGHFSKSQWNSDVVESMSPRIQMTLNTKDSTSKLMISMGVRDSLVLCQNTIKKFEMARSIIASSHSFQGVEKTKTRLNNIASLSSDTYLKNDKSLMTELLNARLSLQKSHYSYVMAQVNRLGKDGYLYLSEDYYKNTLTNEVKSHIIGYTDLFSNTNNSVLSSKSLQSKASEYYREANAYYQRQR